MSLVDVRPEIAVGVAQSFANVERVAGIKLPIWTTLGPMCPITVIDPCPDIVRLFSGDRVQATQYRNGGHIGLANPLGAPPCLGTVLLDLDFLDRKTWGRRSNHEGDQLVQKCSFRRTKKEHGDYRGLRGGTRLIIRDGYYEGNAGQDEQIVQREREWDGSKWVDCSGDLAPGGEILIRDTVSRNAGADVDGDRTGFAWSFFAQQMADGSQRLGSHDLDVRYLLVDKSEQEISTGCLLVQERPVASIVDSVFLAGELVQPIAKFEAQHGEGILFLSRVFAHAAGGQAWIEIEPAWKRVWIAGCKGNVHVHREGQDLGRLEDFEGWLQ